MKYILPLLFLLLGCQKLDINPSVHRFGLFTPTINETITQDLFSNADDSLVLVRRNSTESNAEYAFILGFDTTGIIFPLGKLNATNGSGAPELGQVYYQNRILGGIFSKYSTRSGSWSFVVDNSKYSQGYYNTVLPGASISFTTDSCTRIGLYDLSVSSSGLMLVSIDSNTNLANHLPTAQQFVNAGVFSPSVLSTNGGTLNPNDRVFYQKSPAGTTNIPLNSNGMDSYYTQSRRLNIASGLPNTQHVIKFTNTGYSPIGSTSKQFRISGIWFNSNNISINDSMIGFESLNSPDIFCNGSDNNFAFQYKPLTSSAYDWLGHTGTQFKTNSTIIKVDNNIISSLPMGVMKKCKELHLTFYGNCKHLPTNSTALTYNQVLKITSANGVESTINGKWLVSGIISSGYIPQLGVNDPIYRATATEANQTWDMNLENDQNRFVQIGSEAYMWNPTSNWAIYLFNNDSSTILLNDRSTGFMNKIYFREYFNDTVTTGDIISCYSNYRFKKFLDAELLLAK
jgi:hypothetical protein